MTPTTDPNVGPATANARRNSALMSVVVDAYRGFRRHKGTRLGAALTFYTLLSLSPLVILLLALAGKVFGENAARGEFSRQVEGFIGGEGAKAVEALIASARDPNGGRIAIVIGILFLLFGASGVFL